MAKLITKIYGEALYELAADEKKVEQLFEEVKWVREAVRENAEFFHLMSHPKISKEEKMVFVKQIFGRHVSEEIMGFMHVLVEKNRYMQIEGICNCFIDLVKVAKQIGVAYVITAVPLDTSMRRRVYKRLLESTSYREVEIHYQEDPSIIGGMVIRIGDRVVDSGIAAGIHALKKQLLKNNCSNNL